MTESKTRSKPAAKETDSKPAATKASSSKSTSAKAATVKKLTKSAAPASAKPASAKPASAKPASAKPASAKKAASDAIAAKPVKPKASAAKKPATSKTPVAVKEPLASKAAGAVKKPVKKAGAAKDTVAPDAAAKVKKPVVAKKVAQKAVEAVVTEPVVVEAVVAPVVDAKKRKAAAPKKAKPAQIAPPVPAEVPAPKPSVKGASISFSAVQEPPQHLTLRADVNRVVAFHYRLCEIRPDGSASQWIEESFGRQPLFYLHGHGNVIAGLEQALAGKKAGDAISITLPPELAYGLRTSNDLMRLPIKHLHGNVNPKALVPGSIVTMKTNQGLKNALVMKVGKFNVDVDTNHPYAGRTLHYQIEVLGVRPASAEEVAHRHVHGPGGHQH